jgi:hypothetical protein
MWKEVFSVWSVLRLYNWSSFEFAVEPPESHLTLNGRDIPFVNSPKYLGVIFDRKVTWRLRIEMIEDKAFRTFIRAYFLFKSER